MYLTIIFFILKKLVILHILYIKKNILILHYLLNINYFIETFFTSSNNFLVLIKKDDISFIF